MAHILNAFIAACPVVVVVVVAAVVVAMTVGLDAIM